MTRGVRRGWTFLLAVSVLLLVRWLFGPGGIGSGLLYAAPEPSSAATASPVALGNGSSPAPGSGGGIESGTSSNVYLASVTPMQVTIPSIGVNAPVIRLGLNGDRSVEVPSSFSVAGWYQGSAVPGSGGRPTVILGHVSSRAGPGVFYRLRTVQPGASVWVMRADGGWVRYVIDGIREFPKARFPTKLVYAARPGTTIRLITCGGAFDASTGHFVDNIIAFGHLA